MAGTGAHWDLALLAGAFKVQCLMLSDPPFLLLCTRMQPTHAVVHGAEVGSHPKGGCVACDAWDDQPIGAGLAPRCLVLSVAPPFCMLSAMT
jgi:hypothetical protein